MMEPQPSNGSGLTGADMLALVAHITGLLSEMEGRIMDRLSDNASGAEARWVKHDLASERTIGGIREEIAVLRADFVEHLRVANAHFTKDRDEDLIADARVKPVKTILGWAIANWKNIALLVIAVLTALGILGGELRAIQ